MTSPLLLNGASGEVGPARARPAREMVKRMYLILLVVVVVGRWYSRVEKEGDRIEDDAMIREHAIQYTTGYGNRVTMRSAITQRSHYTTY